MQQQSSLRNQMYPFCSPYEFALLSSAILTAAVNNTSVEEFNAVSAESWITPIIKPTPITCAAISFGMLNKLHANGINKSEPPATPDAPQAQIEATMLNNNADQKSGTMPCV